MCNDYACGEAVSLMMARSSHNPNTVSVSVSYIIHILQDDHHHRDGCMQRRHELHHHDPFGDQLIDIDDANYGVDVVVDDVNVILVMSFFTLGVSRLNNITA